MIKGTRTKQKAKKVKSEPNPSKAMMMSSSSTTTSATSVTQPNKRTTMGDTDEDQLVEPLMSKLMSMTKVMKKRKLADKSDEKTDEEEMDWEEDAWDLATKLFLRKKLQCDLKARLNMATEKNKLLEEELNQLKTQVNNNANNVRSSSDAKAEKEKEEKEVEDLCVEAMDALATFYLTSLSKDCPHGILEKKDFVHLPFDITHGKTEVVMRHGYGTGSYNGDETPKWNWTYQEQDEQICNIVKDLLELQDKTCVSTVHLRGSSEYTCEFRYVGYGRVEETVDVKKNSRIRRSYKLQFVDNCDLKGRNKDELEERKKQWLEENGFGWTPPSEEDVMKGVPLDQSDPPNPPNHPKSNLLDKVEHYIQSLSEKRFSYGGSKEAVITSDSTSLVKACVIQTRGMVDGWNFVRKRWWTNPHLLLPFLQKLKDCLSSSQAESWKLTLAFDETVDPIWEKTLVSHPYCFYAAYKYGGIILDKIPHKSSLMSSNSSLMPFLVLSRECTDLDDTNAVYEMSRGSRGRDVKDCFKLKDTGFCLPLGILS